MHKAFIVSKVSKVKDYNQLASSALRIWANFKKSLLWDQMSWSLCRREYSFLMAERSLWAQSFSPFLNAICQGPSRLHPYLSDRHLFGWLPVNRPGHGSGGQTSTPPTVEYKSDRPCQHYSNTTSTLLQHYVLYIILKPSSVGEDKVNFRHVAVNTVFRRHSPHHAVLVCCAHFAHGKCFSTWKYDCM